MEYVGRYGSPLGEMLIVSCEEYLTELWFSTQSGFAEALKREHTELDSEPIKATRAWLDMYFSGKRPAFLPSMRFSGTPFMCSVWELLKSVPYGECISYGELASAIARERGSKKMSAQAVGGAVGKNRISVIIPCHRVIGAGGELVGYNGGMERKAALLLLEGHGVEKLRENRLRITDRI